MTDTPTPRSYHKVIIAVLVLFNLLAVAFAVYMAEPGIRDYFLREGSYITGFFAAQMFGASLLFVACFFAGNIIPMENLRRWDNYGWLVFAAGFFLLALDQILRLREQLTLAMAGAQWHEEVPEDTYNLIKIIAVVAAIVLAIVFRKVVLANFRMVLAFVAGFWFLLMMLIVDMLFESVGISSQTMGIMEGTAKLLAMAMFVAAPFVALLDRLHDARVLAHVGRRLTSLRDLPPVREPWIAESAETAAEEREDEPAAEPADDGPPSPDEVEPPAPDEVEQEVEEPVVEEHPAEAKEPEAKEPEEPEAKEPEAKEPEAKEPEKKD